MNKQLIAVKDGKVAGIFIPEENICNLLDEGYEIHLVESASYKMGDKWISEREKIRHEVANEMGEKIYWGLLNLASVIENHSWKKQITKYDGELISVLPGKIKKMANELYAFRESLKGEKK